MLLTKFQQLREYDTEDILKFYVQKKGSEKLIPFEEYLNEIEGDLRVVKLGMKSCICIWTTNPTNEERKAWAYDY